MKRVNTITLGIILAIVLQSPANATFTTGQEDFKLAVMGGPLLMEEAIDPQKALPQSAEPVDAKTRLKVENAFAKMPLRFEKNEGQTSNEVKFLSKGKGYTMYLTPTEAVMVLTKTINSGQSPMDRFDPLNEFEPPKTETSVVRMKVVGANPNPKIYGEDQLPGTSNYFLGQDQSKWRQGITNFKKVHYEEVYPGIDLVYYGNQGKLEYDFIVKPGADPDQISLKFEGVEEISLNHKGDLVLITESGKVIQHVPIIYQMIDRRRILISGNYKIDHEKQVTIQLSEYDPGRDLIIDPISLLSGEIFNIGLIVQY